VTTAIVKGGVLLLHRTVDLGSGGSAGARAVETAREQPAAVSDVAAAVDPAWVQAAVEDRPASEVAQAVSVAAAYFEDTLETAPAVVLAAGTLGATALTAVLDEGQVGPVAVQEMVERQMLGAGAESAGSPAGVPLGWLAGVRGALAN
jgi:type IV pilus assembly protein PilM